MNQAYVPEPVKNYSASEEMNNTCIKHTGVCVQENTQDTMK